MNLIICPACGGDETEMVGPQLSTSIELQQPRSLKPPLQNLIQNVVNYAAMGASSARLIKGQRTMIYVFGALIGGAVGCAACILKHIHEQQSTPFMKEESQPQVHHHCLECGHYFN
ncbi:hypothetical protein [Acinetobacter sp. YH16042]|uniref:hypothetical protein n=1 Tax=Acinetobacter sp. YH16042 TaxID=2601186 RepID=UPI0015D2E513|nr:hypothetical protein [Acinetobacter sp. YH16042]